MAKSDLPEVWAIEKTLPGAWTISLLNEEFALPYGWRFIVKSGDALLGYIFGVVIKDEGEIRKLAVAADYRRLGMADKLLTTAIQYLTAHQTGICFLEARQRNTAALKLYMKHGFQQVGIRKSYYTSPCDNAIMLRKDIL